MFVEESALVEEEAEGQAGILADYDVEIDDLSCDR